MNIRIKVCGITHPDDARAAVEAGADLIGLNFVPSSPRCVELKIAEEIAADAGEMGELRSEIACTDPVWPTRTHRPLLLHSGSSASS